jgi:hypothetical protein
VVIFTCIDIIRKNIIEYCGTWYGSEREGLIALFVDLWHIPNDGALQEIMSFQKVQFD